LTLGPKDARPRGGGFNTLRGDRRPSKKGQGVCGHRPRDGQPQNRIWSEFGHYGRTVFDAKKVPNQPRSTPNRPRNDPKWSPRTKRGLPGALSEPCRGQVAENRRPGRGPGRPKGGQGCPKGVPKNPLAGPGENTGGQQKSVFAKKPCARNAFFPDFAEKGTNRRKSANRRFT
jgi:hypothetical protein